MDIGGPGVIGFTRNHPLYNQIKHQSKPSTANSDKNRNDGKKRNTGNRNPNRNSSNDNPVNKSLEGDGSFSDISQLNLGQNGNPDSVFTQGLKDTEVNVIEQKKNNRATKKDLIFNTFPVREWVFGFA